ncbi:hypothetical protein Mycsm_05274 [Mycobacterium sp. JS623]|nr:hypothetical protein Mycsm_05274 [Mycobacterium sp. JS623]
MTFGHLCVPFEPPAESGSMASRILITGSSWPTEIRWGAADTRGPGGSYTRRVSAYISLSGRPGRRSVIDLPVPGHRTGPNPGPDGPIGTIGVAEYRAQTG